MSKSSDQAQCLLGKKDYSCNGRGTTALKSHLQSVNKEVWSDGEKEKKKFGETINIKKTPLQKSKTDAWSAWFYTEASHFVF